MTTSDTGVASRPLPKGSERNHLLEESILPVANNQRPITALGFVWIWVGIAVMIATFQLGANGITGVPLLHVVLIIFFANIVLALLMLLTADIGTEHGLSFSVYLRAPFGVYGTHFPSVFRGVVAAIWFGIQTYLGALALNGIFEYLTGFSSWVTWYFVFAAVQVANTAMGIKAVERLAAIAAPAILAISVWMYFTLDVLAQTQGINIWRFVGDQNVTVLTLFLANVAFWSTLAIDIPNITRFVKSPSGESRFFHRNKNVLLAQLLALPATQAWIALIGAVSFIAAGDWNPVTVIQGQGEGLSLIILLVLVILAQWSTNNAANLIPAALAFVNAGAPRVSYPVAVAIAALVGTLFMPWKILDNLFAFLFSYGAFLSAIGGIMVADYYLIRKRRINVPELYHERGQFHYVRGVNPAGIIAWVVAGTVAFYSEQWAFVLGFLLGALIYFAIMRLIVMKRFAQAECGEATTDSYLGTSAGYNWVYDRETRAFKRVHSSDLEKGISREDL
ncbi:nitrate reductase [Halomonas desiderata]|uniref:NCS1 family transporter n=1 Tax=Billgrantia desiderata TaxID=52021 RepID=UPI00174BB481|nr:NCS1 family transporter [Halomonas desiderata]MCE8011960.1 nitrate reductase [Halomonas desiderata]NIC35488.1 nitrate reductase [Halomonas desiderata]